MGRIVDEPFLPILIYGIAATMLPAGGICIVFGIIGRQVSDHPSCRACSHDLFGTWPRSKVCPECGASLDQSHAVVNGVHEMRRGLLALGAALFILGMSIHTSYFISQTRAGSMLRSKSNAGAAPSDQQPVVVEVAPGEDE